MSDVIGFEAFRNLLSKRQQVPLYLLFGEESFLIDECLRLLKESYLTEGLMDFNLQVFQAAECDVESVRDALDMLPMMCPHRMIVLKQAEEWNDKDWTGLQAHIEKPIDSSVFVVVAEKIDRRKKWCKAFLQNGQVIELKHLYPEHAMPWIQRFAKELDLQLPNSSAQVLLERVGNSLTELRSEMSKLASFLGPGKVADIDVVLQVVSKRRAETVFDFADAIASQDRARALVCLAELLEQGQSEIAILALLQRHFRILKITQEGLAQGQASAKISARAGVPPYFMNKYMSQAKRWQGPMIDRAFAALLDTDRALKSSPGASHIWLENFVLHSCDVSAL